MNTRQENDGFSLATSPFNVSDESRQWLIMMKYMLECAENSLQFLDRVKETLDFDEDDLERFVVLSIALDQARLQMTSIGRNFFEGSSLNFLKDLSLFDVREKRNTTKISVLTQTVKEDIYEDGNRTGKPSKKDSCICSVLEQKLAEESRKKKEGVCYPLKNVLLINEKCRPDGQASKKQTTLQDIPHDEDHPFIVRDTANFTIPETGVGYELFYAMNRNRDKLAQIIEETDEHQTYKQLLRDSISTALRLRKKGLNEHSLVTLCVKLGKYSCVPLLAALFLGCKVNGIDISCNKADMAFFLQLAPPDIIFLESEKLEIMYDIFQETKHEIQLVVMEGDTDGNESMEGYLISSDREILKFRPYKTDSMKRDCVILFSSGTSGAPKATRLSHYTILGQFINCCANDNLGRVHISYESYCLIIAINILGYAVLAGIARVIPLPYKPARFLELVDKYKIESAYLGIFERTSLAAIPIPEDLDTSSLRTLSTGGAALKERVFLRLRKMFPDCCIFQGYGLTETAGVLSEWKTKSKEDVALMNARPMSCGRKYAGFWYKIVDEQTGQIVGPYQQGELCVKSDTMIMNGYCDMDSKDFFDDLGWLKTGDLAYFDEYECLYIVDRMKELIKYRECQIAPITLETILMTHPMVQRAVVVGIPHPIDGEHPMGLIILKENVREKNVDLNEIVTFVNGQVSEKQQLRGGIRIVQSFPITSTGKVKRRFLRDTILYGHA